MLTVDLDQLSVEEKRRAAVALMEKQRKQRQRRPRTRYSRKKKVTPLRSWASLHRRMLRPNLRFSLPDHLYLIDMYDDTGKEIVYMKAGQIGVSELLISYAFHACDQRAADVLYIMPTRSDISDFSQSRFGPALEASPYLDGVVVGSGRAKRGADKVGMKRIRDNFLYLRAGSVSNDGSASQLKSIPVDCLIGDEIDEMDGRAIPIARKRLGHSPIREVRMASTPTYHNVGIHERWEASDQREWMVPCPYCGDWQQLLIENVVLEWDDLDRPVAWHGKDEGRAFVACATCGKEMDRLARGEWVATHPQRWLAGYHPTKLMAAHVDLIEVVLNLQNIDDTSRKEAFNQDLGLPYTPAGGRLTDKDLDACRREYAHGPDKGSGAVMGVDVGKVLHVVIRARPDNKGARRQLFAGEVPSFDDVGHLMHRFDVKTCVIDLKPETKLARSFQAAQPRNKVWLCDYLGGQSEGRRDSPVQWDTRNGLAKAYRTWTLDMMMARFYNEENTLPAGIRGVADFYKHMKALVRVVEEKPDGTKIARYISSASSNTNTISSSAKTADHYAHAENYCLIAGLRPSGWAR